MGLAASQCRFLMLTSRESDVEAKLMQLSNQQLALSTKATKLSSDYAKKLSQQSVYFNNQPVSYNDIMQPNMAADATGNISQFIFKTGKGAVVLSAAKADAMGLSPSKLGGKTGGTGVEFKRIWEAKGGKTAFLAQFVTDYVDTTNAAGGVVNATCYKYDEHVLNNAVVTVTPASVMQLSNYNMEQLEFAMGTQEKQLSSFGCIWSLDKYEYTESNVHSVVNDFVGRAMNEMAKQLMQDSVLGSSTAVVYAINYAKEKTAAKYETMDPIQRPRNADGSYMNIQQTQNWLDGLTERNSNPYIYVSEGVYSTTQTTAAEGGNVSQTVKTVEGRDIFIDTAQLTAVFLNYFDAGMLRAFADGLQNYEERDLNLSASDLNQRQQKIDNLNLLAGNMDSLNNTGNAVYYRNANVSNPAYSVAGYNSNAVATNGIDYLITGKNGTSGYFGDTAGLDDNNGTGNSTKKAQRAFYSNLYDALCYGGWTRNVSVANEKNFLSTQMQRGNIVLCEYTSSSSKGTTLKIDDSDSGLALVDSADLIEQAEAEYEAESAKIDYKTNIIETQMSKLQTELDSIKSEKESIKSIVDSNIDKRFTIFG